jgi:HEAT repeat protein
MNTNHIDRPSARTIAPSRPLARLALAITLALAAPFAAHVAVAAPLAEAGEPRDAEAQALYRSAHDDLKSRDYEFALAGFRRIELQQNARNEPVDAALYWQAYTLNEMRRTDEARATTEKLARRYPKSEWLDDARALTPPRNVDPAAAAAAEDREDQALMAIDALLATGNPKAVPLLERTLAGQHTDKVKGRAIFVLSQIAPERADAALTSILQGNSSMRLKREAIQMIGAGGRRESLDKLLPIFRNSQEPELRRAVLDAWLAGGRGDLVRDAAMTEKDPKTQIRAIQTLGAMGDSAAIRALIPKLADERAQRAAVQSLGVAGDAEGLIELAKTGQSEAVRIEAVQSLGIVSREKAGPAIVSFYSTNQSPKVRRAAINALVANGDGQRLVELYRKESDPKMKRELLNAITATSGDDALEIIDEMLQEPTRSQ